MSEDVAFLPPPDGAEAPGSFRLYDLPRRRPRPSLPVPLTGLIGREAEMAAAGQLLATSRLATLTGPPGTGKTRLALELARALAGEYADGVSFVPLAQLADPDLVMPAIARTIGVELDDARSAHDSLAAELRAAHALLVLDNFEQVVEGARALADLLQQCPRLTALVTSRVPLQVRGERELSIPPWPRRPPPPPSAPAQRPRPRRCSSSWSGTEE